MSKFEIDSRIIEFCDNLDQLDAGEKARLKRNTGRSLDQARNNVFGLFLNQLLPRSGVPHSHEETYFLVATLYPWADGGGTGSLGSALRSIRHADEHRAASLDRRFEILLDANDKQRPFRLRQTLHYLYSQRTPVYWPRLLHDLIFWNDERWHVRETWARDYFVGVKEEKQS